MTEFLLRTSRAPSLVVLIEREGPTRVYANAVGEDLGSLEAWIASSEARRVLVAAALSDRLATGGSARGQRWSRTLAAENPGIVGAVERLFDRQ